jgi:hypothetical protein
MHKTEIKQHLTDSYQRFIVYLQALPDDDFTYAYETKWTAAQHLDHIVKSISPVNTAFAIPALILKTLFGKANRNSRTYDELVEQYKQKLAEGGRASGKFVPPPNVSVIHREKLVTQLSKVVHQLVKRIEGFSEHDLDHFVLPHPLLGKLTLREMLYFTIYHAGHHEKLIKEYLLKRSP